MKIANLHAPNASQKYLIYMFTTPRNARRCEHAIPTHTIPSARQGGSSTWVNRVTIKVVTA